MNKMLQNYQKGMSAFDDCHNSSVRSQWVALKDEIGEFVSEPMTRFIHDQFAKQYLKELLTPLGNVETSRDIAGEVRQLDVLFSPKAEPEIEATALGLLGQIAAKPAVFEPFRSPVQPGEIRSCLGKLFDLHAEFERIAARENTRIGEADLPQLWILSPTVSDPLLAGFRAIPEPENWVNGVYFLGESLKAAIVAIHQLPGLQKRCG